MFGYMHGAILMSTFTLAGIRYSINSIGYWNATYITTSCCVAGLVVEFLFVGSGKSKESELSTKLL